jgi:integrase
VHWVFASPHSNRRLPYWPGAFYRAHLLPAAQKLGIEGIGWNTFRRTYATFLQANGEDVKRVQELLRHANSLVTMNIYAQELVSGFQKVVKIKAAPSNDLDYARKIVDAGRYLDS